MAGSPSSGASDVEVVGHVRHEPACVTPKTELGIVVEAGVGVAVAVGPALLDPPHPVDVLPHMAAIKPRLEVGLNKLSGDGAKGSPGQGEGCFVLEAEVVAVAEQVASRYLLVDLAAAVRVL